MSEQTMTGEKVQVRTLNFTESEEAFELHLQVNHGGRKIDYWFDADEMEHLILTLISNAPRWFYKVFGEKILSIGKMIEGAKKPCQNLEQK